MVVGAAIGRGSRRGREEACLSASLVGRLVHFCLHFLWLANRVSELNH